MQGKSWCLKARGVYLYIQENSSNTAFHYYWIITELLQKWVEILNDREILKLHHVTYLYTPRNSTWCTAQPKFQRKGVLPPFLKKKK